MALIPGKTSTQEVTPTEGASTGTGVGSAIGGVLGTLIPIPGLGTALGAAAGGAVGGAIGGAVDEGNTQTVQIGSAQGGRSAGGYDPLRESRALRDLYRTLGLSLEGYDTLDAEDPMQQQTEGLLWGSMARPEETDIPAQQVQQQMVPDSIAFTPYDPLAFMPPQGY